MILDVGVKHKVNIDMKYYVRDILKGSHDYKQRIAATPAANSLFKIDNDFPKLPSKAEQQYHTIVAKLLFLAKRGCPDFLTAVVFFTTRVVSPTKEDINKLNRVLRYLHHNIELVDRRHKMDGRRLIRCPS